MRKKRKNEVRERESKQRNAKKEEKRGRIGKEFACYTVQLLHGCVQ